MKEAQITTLTRNLFLAKEQRPPDIGPAELALVVRLLVQHADERAVYPSLVTLSLELGCSESAVSASLKRLKKAGWLTVQTGAGRFRPNRYAVVLDALPVPSELKRPTATDDAVWLANTFLSLQRQWQPKRVFHKGTATRYAYTFQTLMNKVGGNRETLTVILNFALGHPAFKKAAMIGPQKLRKVWRSLEAAYVDSLGPNQAEEEKSAA